MNCPIISLPGPIVIVYLVSHWFNHKYYEKKGANLILQCKICPKETEKADCQEDPADHATMGFVGQSNPIE